MAALIVSEVRILDVGLAERYKQLAAASIHRHGGRYLARGVIPDALEGEWDAEAACVIAEFPDEQTARTWYESPDYAEARVISTQALSRRLLLIPTTDQ